MLNKVFFPFVLLFCAGTLLAQSDPQTTAPASPTRPGHQENCFQQAGLERSVVEQIRSIGHETHSQIESICSNSSLTPQQQNQQVREIREKAMQQREGLMTAVQQKAVMACQQARRGYHPVASGQHERHMAGCGEMPRGEPRSGGSPNAAPGNGTGNAPPNQTSPN
jgi:hypothetical protein